MNAHWFTNTTMKWRRFTAKRKLFSILLLLALTVPASLLIFHSAKSSPTDVKGVAGGFLFPWGSQSIYITQNEYSVGRVINGWSGDHSGHEIDLDGPFDIIAPKDGVVIMAKDEMLDDTGEDCKTMGSGANYIVLGYGPRNSNGAYPIYMMFQHLAHGTIPDRLIVNYDQYPKPRVKVGEYLGTTGSTGWSTGNHLHMFATTSAPTKNDLKPVSCSGKGPYPLREWPKFVGTSVIGFEEVQNIWPLNNGSEGTPKKADGTPVASYNHVGLPTNDCNPNTDMFVVYNHIGYGGECKVIPLGITTTDFNVSGQALHISSIAVNDSCTLMATVSDDVNGGGNKINIINSAPDLRTYKDGDNWNDRIKWMQTYYTCDPPNIGGGDLSLGQYLLNTRPSWLQEFSISEKLPLEVRFHTKVEWTSDFDAFRVCFNGENCQETSAVEQTYIWNTYGWDDGDYTVSVQYRRLSDNHSWDNALIYTTQYYLSPDRGYYAPCNSGVDGAILTSGSDCIIVTASVADLGRVGWGDRDTVVTVNTPVEAWVYDSGDYQGAPKVIKNGESMAVGNNMTSIQIKPPAPPPPPDPYEPFTVDANTVHLWHFDENSGSVVFDSIGGLNGVVTSGDWVAGKFGTGMSFPDIPPYPRGLTFAPIDVCPFTMEGWVYPLSGNIRGRVYGQAGGGGNTGENKWLLSFDGTKPQIEIWSAGGSQKINSYLNVTSDRWYFFMFTYDCASRAAKLYIDNVLVGEMTTPATWNSGATTLEFGTVEGGARCNCVIDEVRISNTVRVPVEQSVPTATSTPIPPTDTSTVTSTSTGTDTPTNTATSTSSPTRTPTAPIASPTRTSTRTPSPTRTVTPTRSVTPTRTQTPLVTQRTPTPTRTPTRTRAPFPTMPPIPTMPPFPTMPPMPTPRPTRTPWYL